MEWGRMSEKAGRETVRPIAKYRRKPTAVSTWETVSDAKPWSLPTQAGHFVIHVLALHSHDNPSGLRPEDFNYQWPLWTYSSPKTNKLVGADGPYFWGGKSSNGSNLLKVTEPVRSRITVLSPCAMVFLLAHTWNQFRAHLLENYFKVLQFYSFAFPRMLPRRRWESLGKQRPVENSFIRPRI